MLKCFFLGLGFVGVEVDEGVCEVVVFGDGDFFVGVIVDGKGVDCVVVYFGEFLWVIVVVVVVDWVVVVELEFFVLWFGLVLGY